MSRRIVLPVLAAALASVAVVLAVLLAASGGTSGSPSPGGDPATNPEEVQPGPTADHKPGDAASYWNEERRRDASPAEMPSGG